MVSERFGVFPDPFVQQLYSKFDASICGQLLNEKRRVQTANVLPERTLTKRLTSRSAATAEPAFARR